MKGLGLGLGLGIEIVCRGWKQFWEWYPYVNCGVRCGRRHRKKHQLLGSEVN